MRRFRFLLTLSRVTFLAGMVIAAPGTSDRLVITHVAIVDTNDGKLLTDRDVVIVGGRILSVAPGASIAADTTRLDGRGKYLIPGLWDCHIHLNWTSDSALPLLTALGITEVRDLGGRLTDIERWRTQIADGTLIGPHIMRVGPILNGKSFNAYQFVPGSADATRGAVRLLHFLEMEEIKVHRRIHATGISPLSMKLRSSTSRSWVTYPWKSPR